MKKELENEVNELLELIESKISADKKLLQSVLGDLEYLRNRVIQLKNKLGSE
jgi:polyhydroxyalkanoate synthesis regulator phasin